MEVYINAGYRVYRILQMGKTVHVLRPVNDILHGTAKDAIEDIKSITSKQPTGKKLHYTYLPFYSTENRK